jgi:hypothetical protein
MVRVLEGGVEDGVGMGMFEGKKEEETMHATFLGP